MRLCVYLPKLLRKVSTALCDAVLLHGLRRGRPIAPSTPAPVQHLTLYVKGMAKGMC